MPMKRTVLKEGHLYETVRPATLIEDLDTSHDGDLVWFEELFRSTTSSR